MQEVQQSKEMTLVNNRNLAEQNLALQPRLEHKKEQLTKRYSCLQENFESYQLRKSTLGKAEAQLSRERETSVIDWFILKEKFVFLHIKPNHMIYSDHKW